MTAKNKDDFLYKLHTELHRIGVEDNEDIFADFEEHFRASAEQGLSEEETCEKLGDVKEIARSYVDIESTKINSILANAIEDSRPHVSLKKPGRSEPASVPVSNAETAEDITEQAAPIREITPEHIAVEPTPPPAPTASVQLVKPVEAAEPIRETTPEHIAAEPEPVSVSASAPTEGSQREVTPEHIAEEPAPQSEKAPEQKSEPARDPHVADIPPQTGPQVGSGNGFRWSDLKGKERHMDIGRLIMWICLDLFVFSWALPALGGVIIGFWAVPLSIFASVGGVVSPLCTFHLLSRIFLVVALLSLGALLIMLAVKMVIGFIKIIRNIIIGHVKAIFGI